MSGWMAVGRGGHVIAGGESGRNWKRDSGSAFAGSAVHDEIGYQSDTGFAGFTRTRNNAGGLEGGVSNGQEIRVRVI